jgi:hypothetical protein
MRAVALASLVVLSGCAGAVPAWLITAGAVGGVVAQDVGAVDAGLGLVKSLLPAKTQACPVPSP